KALAHIGQNFSLALTSDAAQWRQGVLWYKTAWQSGHANGAGWLSVATLTFTAPPANADAYASFDVLSPSMANYLASLGDNVGAVVYDVTRHQYYTYNANGLFIQASSAKVPLMVAYLNWIESQGRSPNSNDQSLLTTMIENSNNDSAQVIYDTLGYDIGLNAYLRSIGINDYQPNSNGWGWGRWSPLDMAHILTLLQEGKALNASDRAYALSLMRNIEPDQRMGIGETAPAGATYEMKDGWVPSPDGLWAINTSGIVTLGSETYIITVYTGEQTSYDGGWYITRQVCGPVGKLLA
ncbi:MAG: serine hydrolase, partial [Ktedonobacterales bacterium]